MDHPAGRAGQPAGPGRRGEHLRPGHRVRVHPGHLDREGVRHGRRRDRRDREAAQGRRHPLPARARAPLGPRRLLPGHRADGHQVPVLPRRRPGAGRPDHRLRRRGQAPRRVRHGHPPGCHRVRPGEARAGLRAPVRLGQGPGQHDRLRRLEHPARRPGPVVLHGLPGELPGRADHRRARAQRVRHLARAGCRERPAEHPAGGTGRLGPRHPDPAVLRGRVPQLPCLPDPGPARLHRREDARRWHPDVPRVAHSGARGRPRSARAGDVLRRGGVAARRRRAARSPARRHRGRGRPGLHRPGLPGADHGPAEEDGRAQPGRRGHRARVGHRLPARRPRLGGQERPRGPGHQAGGPGRRGPDPQGRGGGRSQVERP